MMPSPESGPLARLIAAGDDEAASRYYAADLPDAERAAATRDLVHFVPPGQEAIPALGRLLGWLDQPALAGPASRSLFKWFAVDLAPALCEGDRAQAALALLDGLGQRPEV